MIFELPGTRYICDEHSGAAEIPGVVNAIQLVVTPLLTSAGRVVVIIATGAKTQQCGSRAWWELGTRRLMNRHGESYIGAADREIAAYNWTARANFTWAILGRK